MGPGDAEHPDGLVPGGTIPKDTVLRVDRAPRGARFMRLSEDSKPIKDNGYVSLTGHTVRQGRPGELRGRAFEHKHIRDLRVVQQPIGAADTGPSVPGAPDGPGTPGAIPGTPPGLADWERTRPWDALTREAVQRGDAPGFRYSSISHGEDASHGEDGRVVLTDKFFGHPSTARRAILYHEAGHALSDQMLRDGSGFDLFDRVPERTWGPSGVRDFNGQSTPGEAAAEAYSVLNSTDPADREWATRMGMDDYLLGVADEAERHGFPIQWRPESPIPERAITEAGPGEARRLLRELGPPGGDRTATGPDEYLRRAIQDKIDMPDYTHLLVSRAPDGSIAGAMSIEDHLEDPGQPYSVIHYIGAKGDGAGSELVQRAAVHAAERNAALMAEPTPTSASYWTDKMGMTEDPTGMGTPFVGWTPEQTRARATGTPGGDTAPAPVAYDSPGPPEPADSPVWQTPNAELSAQEVEDLYRYAWDLHSYNDINSALREGGGLADPADQQFVDRLTSVIDRSHLPANAILYRGTYDNPELADQIGAAFREGRPWTEHGFMSTSLDPEQSATFHDMGDPSESVSFEISVAAPQGAKAFVFDGALTDAHPDAYDQQEVLLQRGSQFQINGVHRDADGLTHVRMTLTGSDPGAEPITWR